MGSQAFTIGSVTIYWYGVLFSMAFMLCGMVWAALSHRRGYGAGMGFEFGFWLILSSVLGARLAFIIANLNTYLAEPAKVLDIRAGGLIFYGGIIGGLVMTILFAKFKKLPVASMLDISAAGTPLGHSLGRIGCFVNECCYGVHGEGYGTVMSRTGLRIPTQLIEAAGTLLIFLILWRTFKPKGPYGQTAALYLVLYGCLRFTTEFFRGDPRVQWGPLHTAQWISLAAIICGSLWILAVRKKAHQE